MTGTRGRSSGSRIGCCTSAAAAEDVAQEAFVALWRSRHSYRAERGGPGGWLLTITRNRAIDAIRRGRAHVHSELEADRDPAALERTEKEALRRWRRTRSASR